MPGSGVYFRAQSVYLCHKVFKQYDKVFKSMSQQLRLFACALMLLGLGSSGLDAQTTFNIGANLPPVLTASVNQIIQPIYIADSIDVGNSLQVNGGTPTYTYAWTPASIFGDPTAAVTRLKFADTTTVPTVSLTVTDANGCEVTDSITVDYSVDLRDLQLQDVSLEVFPNPNSGTFSVKLDGKPSAAPMQLLVMDALGRTVYSEELPRFQGSLTKELNLSDLSEGAYFLGIYREGKQTFKKLMIQ
jgi:hypothetical protein